MHLKVWNGIVLTIALLLSGLLIASGQSLVSGDISGTVLDPNGAAVTGAVVMATSKETGSVSSTTTSGTGLYRFSLLKPGAYMVAVSANGFKSAMVSVVVTVGQISTRDISLAVGSPTETVEVSAGAQLLQPDSAELSTGFEYEQLQSVPNPGGDLTYVAQTAPGVVMNTGMGFGNFSVFGLPGTSNNFTMNGMQTNDPFLNLNNSGPSNLLLGLNDVQEVNIITNAYGAQFGSFGGAQVNAISRSGGNSFHGNANYLWNGRTMNANNWFNSGNSKPFSNSNQWAAGVGGPIRRDHTFFFANYEGLSFVTAPVDILFLPSASYEASVVGNDGACDNSSSSLNDNGTAGECAFYNNAFSLYNNVPNHSAATAISSDRLQLTSTPKTELTEKLLNGRIDLVFSANDKMFLHFKYDHGVQPTYADPFTSVFDIRSDQPDYEGQLSWTHILSPRAVNQLLLTGSWYSAIFKSPNEATADSLFPETLNFSDLDGYFSDLNRDAYIFPQGRNATQDQIGDDFSYTVSKHTLKFGALYKKNYVSDYDSTLLTNPLVITCGSEASCAVALGADFGNLLGRGISLEAIQDFPQATHVPISLYTLGLYGQDDWKPQENLTLTLGVRFERNSNPFSATKVLSNLGTDFNSFLNRYGASSLDTPYSTMIKSGLSNAFVKLQKFSVEPRFGFTFSPSNRTVLRGGFGIFTDVFPGTIADSELSNPPFSPQFTIFFGGIDPSQSYSSAAQAAQLNTAFQQGFATGGTANTITAADPNFAAPNFTTVASRLNYPTYEEWNLQVQHELGRGNAFEVSYVGNRGYHEPVENPLVNAYGGGPLPDSAPVAAFGAVNEVRSTAISNYHGFVASFLHKSKSLNMQLNYTWSHSLDEISNGGILPFNPGSSITAQIDPDSLAHNYGNADYDIRHYFNGNYLYNLPYVGGPKLVSAGWEISGVIFLHTGLPFTPTQTEFVFGNVGGSGIAQAVPTPGTPHHCGPSSAKTPCLNINQFPTAGDVSQIFAPYDRNQFTGPGYFDTDMTLAKSFPIIHEGTSLKLGITAYNLFNHPNFANPDSNVSSSAFGQSLSTVSPPTSIYGAFLGGDASVRIVQITGKINF